MPVKMGEKNHDTMMGTTPWKAGVVWCGVVWCGVVWCGVVWCGAVWCGAVRDGGRERRQGKGDDKGELDSERCSTPRSVGTARVHRNSSSIHGAGSAYTSNPLVSQQRLYPSIPRDVR